MRLAAPPAVVLALLVLAGCGAEDGSPEALEGVRRASEDPDAQVHRRACEAAGRIGGP